MGAHLSGGTMGARRVTMRALPAPTWRVHCGDARDLPLEAWPGDLGGPQEAAEVEPLPLFVETEVNL